MLFKKKLSEAEYIGFLAGYTLNIIKYKTNKLNIPANFKIILKSSYFITEKAS